MSEIGPHPSQNEPRPDDHEGREQTEQPTQAQQTQQPEPWPQAARPDQASQGEPWQRPDYPGYPAAAPIGAAPFGPSPDQGGYHPYAGGPAPTHPYEPVFAADAMTAPHDPSGYDAQPREQRSQRPGRTVLVAAVTAAVVGGGIGAGTVALLDRNNSTTVTALPVTTQTAPATARIDGTVTAAAAKIQPSVVTLDVAGQQEQGTGSGVIIRSDGYILTNDHVVSVGANGGSIVVVTHDGQQAKARVVGTDPSDDLAVVKVDGLKNLTAATFGTSAKLQVGQAVVAVGAPLGLSDTVTSGIVSNTARPVRSGDNDQAVFNAVQTDAAINPGNSGGPLVDLNGNVVGINAAIASANSGGLQIPGQSTESGSIGIGFAIPSDEASRIATQLIANGKATHAVIGVKVAGQQSQQASSTGARISSVDTGGAASKAGLQAGDVVTAVDAQRIQDADGLIAAIRSHAPGDTVTLTYLRDGTSRTAKVTLGTASN